MSPLRPLLTVSPHLTHQALQATVFWCADQPFPFYLPFFLPQRQSTTNRKMEDDREVRDGELLENWTGCGAATLCPLDTAFHAESEKVREGQGNR
jgi:hypothetical protein